MSGARILRYGLALLLASISLSAISTFAAANTVPATRLDELSGGAVNANTLKPAECASLNLTAVVSGAGNVTGTSASELVLGGSAAQTIRGGNGNDCIVGGGGDDALRGEQGTDVCLGGPGTDSFNSCETQVQ